MEKMISELVDGEHFKGQLLVANSAKCVNNVGANYLNLELRDSSGNINGKKWDVSLEDESIFVIGNVVQKICVSAVIFHKNAVFVVAA